MARRYFKKIDIYRKAPKGSPVRYLCSTNWSRTCREAIENYAAVSGYAASDLFARFDHADKGRSLGIGSVSGWYKGA